MSPLAEKLPESGSVTTLSLPGATVATLRASAARDTLVSSLQRDHLRTRLSPHAVQDELWLGVTWDVSPSVTARRLADGLTHLARRHESLRTWFTKEDHCDDFLRNVAPRQAVNFRVDTTAHLDAGLQQTVLRHLRRTCTPFEPLGYTALHVSGEGETRIVFAMDHAYGDAQSLLIACEELHAFLTDAGRLDDEAPSYASFAQRDREAAHTLTAESEPVRAWVDFFTSGHPTPDLGAFPGWTTKTTTPTPVGSKRFTLLPEQEARALEEHAAAQGATFVAALFACLALAARDETGTSHLRFVNPVQLRTPQEQASVGWYTGLVPMHLTFDPHEDLLSVARRARTMFSERRHLAATPFLAVYDAMSTLRQDDISSWNGRFMLSYIDTRTFGDLSGLDPNSVSLVSGSGEDVNVSAWIFRGKTATEVLVVAPEDPQAMRAAEVLFTTARTHAKTLL